jgi:hypothetical protein
MLRGDALSSFCAPARKHAATAGTFGTNAESMRFCSLSFLRLVGSLHNSWVVVIMVSSVCQFDAETLDTMFLFGGS